MMGRVRWKTALPVVVSVDPMVDPGIQPGIQSGSSGQGGDGSGRRVRGGNRLPLAPSKTFSEWAGETVFRGQTVTGCPEKLSPPSANPLILRFLPKHFRMLGGEARHFASVWADFLGVHPAWNPPPECLIMTQ
jgi:hypothetical protein